MQKLIMDIKCNNNPYSFSYPRVQSGTVFRGVPRAPKRVIEKSVDIFVKRPADAECAAGLLSSKPKFFDKVKNYAKNYVKNIKHTYDHKVIFALVEKELFGKNTIDSLTHDADKMVLYLLGFPKSFVSEYHRKHSAHHPQSGKKMNLRSMLCDNIASSPEFKPEKKRSLRDHYATCKELQEVNGLGDVFERYNYGENLNFAKINLERDTRYAGIAGFMLGAAKLFLPGLI